MRTLALVAALVGALLPALSSTLAAGATPANEGCQGACGGQVCRVPGTGAGGNCLRDDADCDDRNDCTADQCTSEGCVSAYLCV
jgi:hypothetical protein